MEHNAASFLLNDLNVDIVILHFLLQNSAFLQLICEKGGKEEGRGLILSGESAARSLFTMHGVIWF